MIGKHLATFDVFREPDGLYVTCADARGVAKELNGSGAPLRLCAMNALREAMRQMDSRAASAIEAPSGVETGNTDSTEGESAGPKDDAQGSSA